MMGRSKRVSPSGMVAALLVSAAAPALAHAAPVDTLRLGDPASEAAHGTTETRTEVITGGLGQKARRFLPIGGDAASAWRGGSVSFTIAVDPTAQNYVTARLWGDDHSVGNKPDDNQMTLFCDGKQIGFRHQGEVDVLDQGSQSAIVPGRFYYVTHPLTKSLTSGKSKLSCTIRASGPISRYVAAFAKFQRPMTEPTRGLYAVSTHTDPFFAGEAQNGTRPVFPLRPKDSVDPFLAVRQRVDKTVTDILKSPNPPHQIQMLALARAYATKWTVGYRSKDIVRRIVEGVDVYYERFKQDPTFPYKDPATTNPSWIGMGRVGDALRTIAPALGDVLDKPLKDATGAPITRRDAWAALIRAGIVQAKATRRVYTNQSIINDTSAIYLGNEGLIAIKSPLAEPRAALLPFLYQSLGLEIWTGAVDATGKSTYAQSIKGDDRYTVGRNYRLVTAKGLTKEQGFVGSYGEVLEIVSEAYEATQPAPDQPGDPRIRAQLIKMALARTPFRYPHADNQGNRTMRYETVVGWRDMRYPGGITYGQKGDANSALQSAVLTGDPRLIGYAQQMIADNQYFETLKARTADRRLEWAIGIMADVGYYAALQKLPRQPYVLPMSEGQPDFVFADPENAVVAVKHGADILYANLYWRAYCGINRTGRVHLITPQTDRAATVMLDREEFVPSGDTYVRPNTPHIACWRSAYTKYPGDDQFVQANTGEILPIAQHPEGATYKNGTDEPFAGRADYYQMTYGRYLIAVNASASKSFDLMLPPRKGPVKELVTGMDVAAATAKLRIPPMTTSVVYLDAP